MLIIVSSLLISRDLRIRELSVLPGSPVTGSPLGQWRLILPSRSAVAPGVQIHDEIRGFGVPVLDLALVAVWIHGDFVVAKRGIRGFAAGLCAHRDLEA